jgi:hypothetical protein
MSKHKMTLEEFQAIFKERDEAKSPDELHAQVVRTKLQNNLSDLAKLYNPPKQKTQEQNTQEQKTHARQVGGDHYKTKSIQPWDVIDTLPHAEAIGFYRGNAIKYLMRAGAKTDNPARQDYEKALHYIEKLLDTLR